MYSERSDRNGGTKPVKEPSSAWIRQWHRFSPEEIRKHLILVDDLYGMCAKCRTLGLNYLKDSKCTGCGTEFKYLATKLTDPGEIAKLLSRIEAERPGLTVIDRADYDKATARDALSGLFSS